MRFASSLTYFWAIAVVTVQAQSDYNDYGGGDYQDYQDYANYDQGGYGQEDNLYANYADRQAQKAM